jgi:fatty-acyl-CoA synthase
MRLGSILTQSAQLWPERRALVDEQGRAFSYRAWNARVNQLANALGRLGVGPGTRVAFFLRNVEALASAYMATQKLGAVAVPVNYRLSAAELTFILNDCQAAMLLYERPLRAAVEGARPALESVEQFVRAGPGDGDALDYEGLYAGAPDHEPEVQVEPDDLSVLMYTSGTTGTPKGVMLTHRHQWLHTLLAGWELAIGRDDRTLHVAPLYHSAAFHSFFLTHVMSGGCNALLPSFEPEQVAATLARERITVLFGVPTNFELLADSRPGLWDGAKGTLRLCTTAAATTRPATVAWIRERLCDAYGNWYGLTESTSMVTLLEPREAHRQGAVNCIGRALVGMEARVIRAGEEPAGPDEEVAAGEVGELIFRGPKLMLGYLNRPEQTARRLRHGWLYTGDLVYRDDDHHYYILDRLDDAISVGGEQVYPKEIERVLEQHPRIKQSAVIGIPDTRWGQLVKAFVVPDGPLSVQDVKDFCRSGGRLARFKVPREIELVEEIPTNPAGKVLKHELRRTLPAERSSRPDPRP